MTDTQKKKGKNFLIQGSILAMAGIVCRIIGMIYRMPMTNIFGDEGNGYYDAAFSIYNIALIISSYGMPLAVSKVVAAKVALNQYKNERRALKGALLFAATTGLVMALIIFFGADVLATVFYKSPNVAIPLKVLSPTIFLCAMMGTIRGYFQGNGDMIPTSVSQIIEQIVNAVVSVWATYTFVQMYKGRSNAKAYGAAGGTLGTTVGALVGLLVLIIIFVARNKSRKERIASDTSGVLDSYKDIFKLICATMIPVIVSQTVYNLNSVVDRAVYSHMSGFSEKVNNINIGMYGKYVLMVNIPVAIATALGNSIVPAIVAEKVKDNVVGIKTKVNAAIKFNMLIAIPCTVGLAVLSKNIMRLLFGGLGEKSVHTSGMLLTVGSLAVAFYALSTMSNAILQALHLMKLPIYHSVVAFVIHLGFIVVFILSGMGIYSLAVGNVIFALIVCILNWRSIAKELNYKQEIKTTFVLPSVSAIIMGIATWGVCKLMIMWTHSNAIGTLVSIMVAVMVYAVALVKVGCLTKDEVLGFPKGRTLYRLMVKLHLIK